MSTSPSSLDLLVKNGVLEKDPSVDVYGKPSEYLKEMKSRAASQLIPPQVPLRALAMPTMSTRNFLAAYHTPISNYPGVQQCYQLAGASPFASFNNYKVPEKKLSIKDLFTKTNDIVPAKTESNATDSQGKSGWKKWVLGGLLVVGGLITYKVSKKCIGCIKNVFAFPGTLWEKFSKLWKK